MNGLDQNPAIAVLSQDDSAIENAFSDLDTKIAAWVDAMDKASVALAQVARVEPVAQPVEAPPAVEATPVANDVAEAQEVRAEAVVIENESPAEASSGIVSLPGRKKSKKPSLKAKTRKLAGGAKSGEGNPTDAAPPTPVIVEKTKEELDAEDEALLAQLDPKVAKSIHIKRRLSQGRKSVKELINEMHK